MLFGEKYDLSLGYILKANGTHKRRIINFLKELPRGLLENIRSVYVEGDQRNFGVDGFPDENPKSFYNFRSKNDPSIKYDFMIMASELYISKTKEINGTEKRIFTLTLGRAEYEHIKNLKTEEKKPVFDEVLTGYSIGVVCIGDPNYLNYREINYRIKKTKDGYNIMTYYIMLGMWAQMRFYKPITFDNPLAEVSYEKLCSNGKKLELKREIPNSFLNNNHE